MLGQNVNSYWDQEALSSIGWIESRERLRRIEEQQHQQQVQHAEGGDRRVEEAVTLAGAVEVAVEPYAYSIASGFSQRTRVQSRGAKKSNLEAKESQSILENGLLEREGEGGEEVGGGVGRGGEVEWQGEGGVRFSELLSLVAAIDPDNMRIRFQSPHPKDFPNEVGR